MQPDTINLLLRFAALLAICIVFILLALYVLHRANQAHHAAMLDIERRRDAEKLRPMVWTSVGVPAILREQAGVRPGPVPSWDPSSPVQTAKMDNGGMGPPHESEGGKP